MESPTQPPRGCPLSSRQLACVRGLLEGKGAKQIGLDLGLKPSTVRQHHWAASQVLGVRGRTATAAVVNESGWLDPISDYSDTRVTPAQRLYLDAFDRYLRGWRDEAKRAKARQEMRHMLGAMFIECDIGEPPPQDRPLPPTEHVFERELDRSLLP